MSRYIDADAMKEWLDEYLSVFKKYDKSEVKGFVEHQPSIDIVRCKECRWARPRTLKGETGYRCIFYCTDKAENGYCDCGERE